MYLLSCTVNTQHVWYNAGEQLTLIMHLLLNFILYRPCIVTNCIKRPTRRTFTYSFVPKLFSLCMFRTYTVFIIRRFYMSLYMQLFVHVMPWLAVLPRQLELPTNEAEQPVTVSNVQQLHIQRYVKTPDHEHCIRPKHAEWKKVLE